MIDAGREEIEGATLIYAVCEFPDDFLAGVLQERPLSPAEAREALRSAVEALRFLHGRGVVHGAVDPSHIMAFGETIKLPSDTWERPGTGGERRTGAYDPPEGALGTLTPAADIWALAITLHEMLTQQRPNLERDPEFRYLAEPFARRTRARACRIRRFARSPSVGCLWRAPSPPWGSASTFSASPRRRQSRRRLRRRARLLGVLLLPYRTRSPRLCPHATAPSCPLPTRPSSGGSLPILTVRAPPPKSGWN
jgi:serine/threonine protein kinase